MEAKSLGEWCYYEKGGDVDVLRWGRVEFAVPVGHPGGDLRMDGNFRKGENWASNNALILSARSNIMMMERR